MVLGFGWRFIISLPYAFMIMLLIEKFRGFKDATEIVLAFAIVQGTALIIANVIIWAIARKARSGYSKTKL